MRREREGITISREIDFYQRIKKILCYHCESCEFPILGDLVECDVGECVSFIAGDGTFSRKCSAYKGECNILGDEAKCIACETDKCNGIIEGIECNSCDNCTIDDLGTLVTCDNRIEECFIHVKNPITKTYSRGCSSHVNYCNDLTNDEAQCISCNTARCNDITKVIDCYSCDNCEINDLGSVETADIRTNECYIHVVDPLNNKVSRGYSKGSSFCEGKNPLECWKCSEDKCNTLMSKCLTCVDERPNGKCSKIQAYEEEFCFPQKECYFTSYGVNGFYKSERSCGSSLKCLEKDWLSLGVDAKYYGGESFCETCVGVQCNNRRNNGNHAYTNGYFNIFLTVLYFIYIYL